VFNPLMECSLTLDVQVFPNI